MKMNIYQKVTDTIVAQLEKGVRPRFPPDLA
jgi:antirestriction protein ArdC